MHTAVRPFTTAGIALMGASVIALAPVTGPPITTHIDRAAAHLAAATSPLAAYGQVFDDTVANVQTIFSTAATNGPTPILTAILTNQIAAIQAVLRLIEPAASTPPTSSNATASSPLPTATAAAVSALPPAVQSTLSQLLGNLTTTVPGLLTTAIQDLLAGNVENAVDQTLLAGLTAVFPLTNLIAPTLDAIADPLQHLVTAIDHLGPLATIVANPAQNVVNVLKALNEGFLGLPPTNAITVLGGILGPLIEAPAAAGAAIQGVIDAARAGNPEAVVKAIVSAPAVVIGGLLNGGYGPDLSSVIDTGFGIPLQAGGLLTQFAISFGDVLKVNLPGTIPALQVLQKLIADALKPPTVAVAASAASTKLTAARTSSVSALPDLSSPTLSVTSAPSGTAKNTSGVGATAPKDGGGTLAASAAPASDSSITPSTPTTAPTNDPLHSAAANTNDVETETSSATSSTATSGAGVTSSTSATAGSPASGAQGSHHGRGTSGTRGELGAAGRTNGNDSTNSGAGESSSAGAAGTTHRPRPAHTTTHDR